MVEVASGKITRNTFYLTASYVVQKVLALVYFTFLARHFGTDGLGQYVFALSFATMFSVVTDLGINAVITKETAKNQRWGAANLGYGLALKLMLAVLAYGGLFLAINLLGYPAAARNMVYLAGVFMLMDSFTTSFYAVFRGWQQIKYEGLGTILYQSIVLIIGGTFLIMDLPLIYFIGVFLFASFANFSLASILLYRRGHFKFWPRFDREIIKKLLVLAAPFALAGIFTKIYSSADAVLLSKMAGNSAVGIYGSASKLTLALQFIPAAFGASIFPAFSNYYQNSRDQLAKTFEKSWRYLLALALPISAGCIALAPEIIQLIYGAKFSASAAPLQILMGSLGLIFLFYPLGALLNGCDRQNLNTVNLGLAMLVNILLNLLLIPVYSYLGASWAVLGSYLVLIGGGLIFASQIIDFRRLRLWRTLFKIAAAAILMGLGVHFLKTQIYFLWLIVPAALIYALLLVWWRVISREDWQSLFKVIQLKFKIKS